MYDRILVTGGAGYVGSHIVWHLVDHGVTPFVVDDMSAGYPHNLPTSVPLINCDIGDEIRMRELLVRHRIEAIVHCAARTSVPESIKEPLLYWRENVMKLCSLLSAAAPTTVSAFVFSSSAAVYGNNVLRCRETDFPITEAINPYGRTKRVGELLLRDSSIPYVILRYFNVAGADPKGRTGQSGNGGSLFKAACRAALGDGKIDVFGWSEGKYCMRDFVHPTDIADANLKALKFLANGGMDLTANIGSGEPQSVHGVIQEVSAVAGRYLERTYHQPRPGDPEHVGANIRTAADELAWFPVYSDLKTITSTALDWERKLQQAPA